ncbi:MAG: NlpC/P60 family protein [Ruminococcus sp.]|nr:NlpC/P60 family protein [Ruminococcus sp.]
MKKKLLCLALSFTMLLAPGATVFAATSGEATVQNTNVETSEDLHNLITELKAQNDAEDFEKKVEKAREQIKAEEEAKAKKKAEEKKKKAEAKKKLRQEIVDYADQFVGNPYVYGGNSLTNGIDCSHFVYQVLENCGVSTGGYTSSAGWRTKGKAVDGLENAKAGDVICYEGHVAIYDGEGGIVEALGAKWGITHYRSATCKTILAIRRFV